MAAQVGWGRQHYSRVRLLLLGAMLEWLQLPGELQKLLCQAAQLHLLLELEHFEVLLLLLQLCLLLLCLLLLLRLRLLLLHLLLLRLLLLRLLLLRLPLLRLLLLRLLLRLLGVLGKLRLPVLAAFC